MSHCPYATISIWLPRPTTKGDGTDDSDPIAVVHEYQTERSGQQQNCAGNGPSRLTARQQTDSWAKVLCRFVTVKAPQTCLASAH
jgi:hypothetical protein